jgi:hypothetical protein
MLDTQPSPDAPEMGNQSAPSPPGSIAMRWRVLGVVAAACAVIVVGALWVRHVRAVADWLQVYTGTVNEPGQYYAFWSGFGSDLAEFGILGAAGAAVYHLFKRWNCHEPGCWRIGTHPAAGGQFNLCYHHHPDFQGRRPTHEMIERMHRQHVENQLAIHTKLAEVHQRLVADGVLTDAPSSRDESQHGDSTGRPTPGS